MIQFASILLGAAQLASAAPEASLATDTGVFTAVCLNGEARFSSGAAQRIDFGRLPATLRERLGNPTSANVWRLNRPEDTFLYVLDYDVARGISPKICGLASASLDISAASDALDMQLAGSTIGEQRAAMQWLMPEDGYTATATRAARFTVLQINWLNPKDRAAAIKRLRAAK